jgi:hypothetical protein
VDEHALQPVPPVDHPRDELDVDQFDEAVSAELDVAVVATAARDALAHRRAQVVACHAFFPFSMTRDRARRAAERPVRVT